MITEDLQAAQKLVNIAKFSILAFAAVLARGKFGIAIAVRGVRIVSRS
ncbi:MAG: hypothetical protein ABIJ96_07730 [Elusimicrobiota bacterium]